MSYFPTGPFLEGYDGHTCGSTQSTALAVTKDTPDPINGFIVHDPKTGEPTGALKEDTDALVKSSFPRWKKLGSCKPSAPE
jgi:predicted amidohydrolase YtcJ